MATSTSPSGSPTRFAGGDAASLTSISSTLSNPFTEHIAHEHAWTTKDLGRNCISTILNESNPQQQSKAALLSQKLVGQTIKEYQVPQVPSAHLKRVRYTDFDLYLKHIQPVFDKYLYNRTIGLQVATEGTPSIAPIDPPTKEELNLAALLARYSPPGTFLAPATNENDPTKAAAQKNANVPALDTIPEAFFQPVFQLDNPATFSLVTLSDSKSIQTLSDVTNPTVAASKIANAQETLSKYLDTVEVHLIREISRRSGQFFAALSNLQTLHAETEDCVKRIAHLRTKLQNVGKINSTQGLEVVRLKRRRGNLGVLCGGIKLVHEIKQTQPMIQVLLNHSDYVGALDLIEETRRIVRGVQSGTTSNLHVQTKKLTDNQGKFIKAKWNMDLREVKSLKFFSVQIEEMTRNIGMIMESDLINILLNDIRDTISTIDSRTQTSTLLGPKMSEWISNILNGRLGSPQDQAASEDRIGTLINSDEMERVQNRLRPVVLGLLRMDRLNIAFDNLKDALRKELKALVKKHYPAVLPEEKKPPPTTTVKTGPFTQANATPLAQYLRSLSFEPFYNFLAGVYITLLHVQARMAVFSMAASEIIQTAEKSGVVLGEEALRVDKVEDVVATSPQPQPSRRDEEDDELGRIDIVGGGRAISSTSGAVIGHSKSESSTSNPGVNTYASIISAVNDVVYFISDEAQTRCAKLISVKQDASAHLAPREFYRLFCGTWEFINAGEWTAARTLPGNLKGTMVGQAKQFFTAFHTTKSRQISMIIDSEQWMQSDVPVEFQRLVDDFVFKSTGVKPGEDERAAWRREMFGTSADSEESLDLDELDGTPSQTNASPSKSQKKDRDMSSRALIVQGREFYMVGASLMFLRVLSEYVEVLENVHILSVELNNKILELLKTFNSRVCQLILGAGAIQSAGLEHITTKHLALAAQSVNVMMALAPHLKAIAGKYLTERQQVLLNDYDKAIKDFAEHESELYARLVKMMEDRLLVHLSSFSNILWDEAIGASETAEPNNYVFEIVKDTTILHKMLRKYMEPSKIKTLMGQVFEMYKTKFAEFLSKMDIYNIYAKTRLLTDVQCLIQKLSALQGIDGIGNSLEVVVNNMPIKDKRPPGTASLCPPSTTRAASSTAPQGKSSSGGMGSIFGSGKKDTTAHGSTGTGGMSSLFGLGRSSVDKPPSQPPASTSSTGSTSATNSSQTNTSTSSSTTGTKMGSAFAKMFKVGGSSNTAAGSSPTAPPSVPGKDGKS